MEKILITKENAGLRLDKFLAKEFFSLSRGELSKKIKQGLVKLDSAPVKSSCILKEGDEIELLFTPEAAKQELAPNKELKLGILYEDANILVLNKPFGIQVHPSHGEIHNTLANALVAYLPTMATVHDGTALAWMRPGIVHRLDKDTSGVMVVAKTQAAFQELKQLFQKRLVAKKYLALVYGQPKEKKGVIDKEIARAANYRKQVIAGVRTKTKSRPAVTEYEVIKEYQEYSLIEARPKTGRTHQIRVHLASLGHPIVGDDVYGKGKNTIQPENKPKRQLLHAQKLTFELFAQKYDFLAPLPADFQEFLDKIPA